MPKKGSGLSEIVISIQLKQDMKAAAKARGITLMELIRRAFVCWSKENGRQVKPKEAPAQPNDLRW